MKSRARASLSAVALAASLAIRLSAQATPAPEWKLAEDDHFEVYSQSGDDNARSALAWFGRLRAFFLQQHILPAHPLPKLRVIVFGSSKEYEPYRLRITSDAYYVAAEGRDYILMAASGPGEFAVAAHEYTHFVLHASGYRLPPWLAEGLAEVFSTARIGAGMSEIGGDLPARSQVLRRRTWIPIPELLEITAESPERQNRDGNTVFYAESWALADLLVFSPAYAPRFQEFLLAASSGVDAAGAFRSVYGKSADDLMSDLHARFEEGSHAKTRSPGIPLAQPAGEVSSVSPRIAQTVLADALLASGDLDRSEAIYQTLARDPSPSAEVWAALGTIALRRGMSQDARAHWKRAMEAGLRDPAMCYRYAVLASDAGLPSDELRAALELAVAARPGFDDARYMLALVEKNTGHFDRAVEQLRAMHDVGPSRAYGYWTAMAYSLTEIGKREEAVAAAERAREHAATDDERANANMLAYIARTDLAVRFERDESGRAKLVTTRIPHDTAHFNPFIESGDDLRRVDGTLQEIDCAGENTRVRVSTPDRLLTLAIPDVSRVEMRNAPAEFVCGPQADLPPVTVEYAASRKGPAGEGLLRGMEFKRPGH